MRKGAIIGDRAIRGKPPLRLTRHLPLGGQGTGHADALAIIRRIGLAVPPSKVRPSPRVVLVVAAVATAAAVAFTLFFSEPPTVVPRTHLGTPERTKELVVLVRPAPVVYFPGPAGKVEGLDADLLRLYASEKKLALRFIPVDDVAKLWRRSATATLTSALAVCCDRCRRRARRRLLR